MVWGAPRFGSIGTRRRKLLAWLYEGFGLRGSLLLCFCVLLWRMYQEGVRIILRLCSSTGIRLQA